MSDQYEIGFRVGATSDDAALQGFETHLKAVLSDSAALSASLAKLSGSFSDTENAADKSGQKVKESGKRQERQRSTLGALPGRRKN